MCIRHFPLHLSLHILIQEPRWGTLIILCQMKPHSTPKWTYSTILTKNKFHLAHFDHARYPYISLKV